MIWYDSYTIFNVLRIAFLILGGWCVRKFWKKFPEQMIPLLIFILSTVLTILILPRLNTNTSWSMKVVNGPICGLAAVGCHQLWKQTISYFKTYKLRKAIRRGDKVTIQKIS